MLRALLFAGASLIVAGVALWVGLVLTLRTGYGPGLTAIRRLNRRFTNPRVLKTAGRPGAPASVIRHVGRTTGTAYQTPVGVVDSGDDLLIVLPYRTTPDWLKNVLAAGAAEVVHQGRTLRVGAPEVVDAAALAPWQSRRERFVQRLYGIDLALRLRKARARAD